MSEITINLHENKAVIKRNGDNKVYAIGDFAKAVAERYFDKFELNPLSVRLSKKLKKARDGRKDFYIFGAYLCHNEVELLIQELRKINQ